MKKSILYLIFIISMSNVSAQSGFTDWDTTYKLKDPVLIIESEIEYADKVEKDTVEAQYYVALNKYRFVAEFTGNERKIDAETMKSMSNVILVKLGRKDIVNYKNVNSEFEFISGGKLMWMPIQAVLKNDFRNEIKRGDKVLLYTLFMNEHTHKKELNNIFFISEFTNKWK